jgi:2-methylaconitate cis-trans-isomerase PrpF
MRQSSAGALDFDRIPAALVRCGTSRILVLGQQDVAAAPSRDGYLLDLIVGRSPNDGLGADHYQDGKVALLDSRAGPGHCSFRFYQVDVASGRVLADMECCSATTAVALFAMLQGTSRPDPSGWMRCVNAGTGQVGLVRPAPDGSPCRGTWTVRLSYGPRTTITPIGIGSALSVRVAGGTIHCWPVYRGNYFVYAETDRHQDPTPELVSALEAAAEAHAPRLEVPAPLARAPKVVLFHVADQSDGCTTLDAACVFRGMRHRSIPGSAALQLAISLELGRRPEVEPGTPSVVSRYLIRHASGAMPVTLDRAWSGGTPLITAEIPASVRLLLYGGVEAPAVEAQAPEACSPIDAF